MAAPPSAALGLAFDSQTYRILLKWHLGIPLVPSTLEGSTCPLACGTCGHFRRPHGMLQTEQALGATPWHSIIPEPVFAIQRYSASSGAVGGRGPQEGCRHPYPILGSRSGPGN